MERTASYQRRQKTNPPRFAGMPDRIGSPKRPSCDIQIWAAAPAGSALEVAKSVSNVRRAPRVEHRDLRMPRRIDPSIGFPQRELFALYVGTLTGPPRVRLGSL